MKIGCACGELIRDQTDDLPHKAHLIPDVDWSAAIDNAVAAVEALADGHLSKDEARSRVYDSFYHFSRPLWQCKRCGRIYVDDPRDGRSLSCYVPQSAEEDFEALRRSSKTKTAIDAKKEKNAEPTPEVHRARIMLSGEGMGER